jgi:hypothetical protein
MPGSGLKIYKIIPLNNGYGAGVESGLLQQLRQLRALAAVHWGCRPWSPDWSPSGAMQRYVGNRGSSRPARLALETTS